jgi:hypothetical protein
MWIGILEDFNSHSFIEEAIRIKGMIATKFP